MNDVHKQMRAHMWANVFGGYFPPREELPDLPELQQLQWSEEFEKECLDRMVMGAFRYGSFRHQLANDACYDNMHSAEARIQKYKQDGNLEHLIDIANLARVEFIQQRGSKELVAQDDGLHAAKPKK